jgi:hypothetical protein
LGFLRRANSAEVKTEPRTRTALYQALLQNGCLGALQKILCQLLNPATALDENRWNTLKRDSPSGQEAGTGGTHPFVTYNLTGWNWAISLNAALSPVPVKVPVNG